MGTTTNFKSNSRYTYAQLAASTPGIKSGFGLLGGIFISSTSSGTITIYDNTAGSGTKIVDTFTPAANTSIRFETVFRVGLSVVITNTISFTIFYQ